MLTGFALLTAVLAGCAGTPAGQRPVELFHDDWFAAPADQIDPQSVFAVSEEMRQYLNTEIAALIRAKGRQRGLYEALYDKRRLRLDYDDSYTRNAAQAFHDHTGNCLSLVIMTGAFAREIGLPVQYQDVLGSESWSRRSDLNLTNKHINISLVEDARMTIDFLSPEEIRSQRRRVQKEETVVAMYMVNRATEALEAGQMDNAYAWVRAAIRQDPKFLTAYNTLGVIYLRHGNLDQAEKVLSYVLAQEPGNVETLSNLAVTLGALGRKEESELLRRQVEQMRPFPPFHFFDLGMKALKEKNYQAARDLFNKEIDRDQSYHEFHVWLAAAYVGLDELGDARKHLLLAIENSTTRTERDIYRAELAKLAEPSPDLPEPIAAP